MKPEIQGFFDPATSTITYVVFDQDGGACAVIDPVLDYDPKAGRTSTASADRVVDFVRERGLTVQWLLETHAHADHLSAAPYLQEKIGGRIGIGSGIRTEQHAFSHVFTRKGQQDGSQFGRLFEPDEEFVIGALTARALHVPGHTPADMAFQIGDAVFVG
ncbi:MAG TPA: MBL fold metallo-hydrolase, partial [Pseudoduganella sp.]